MRRLEREKHVDHPETDSTVAQTFRWEYWQAQWNTTHKSCLSNEPTATRLAAWMSINSFISTLLLFPQLLVHSPYSSSHISIFHTIPLLFSYSITWGREGSIKHLLHRSEQVVDVAMGRDWQTNWEKSSPRRAQRVRHLPRSFLLSLQRASVTFNNF